MRVAYLDESGTSPKEPVLAVAGILIHGDTQLISVEAHLGSLVEKHIPEDKREGFVFHATEIYHGGGRKSIFRDKEEWPDERRWAILDDLVAVPAKFKLPVCISYVERSKFPVLPEGRTATQLEKEVVRHALALAINEMAIEWWMREHTTDEVAILIAENNNDVRLAAKEAHQYYRHPKALDDLGFHNDKYFPFVKIRDGLHFGEKSESRHLQIADACAWALRRFINGAPDAARFYSPFELGVFGLVPKPLAVRQLQG